MIIYNMNTITSFFQKLFSTIKEVQVLPYNENVKLDHIHPLFVEVDQSEFEEYKTRNKTSLKEFLANIGTRRILTNQQEIPRGFVSIEKGWTIKMRFN